MHSTIIFPDSQVSDFTGNLRALKVNKAQTKRENITDVQYFCTYQHGVVSSTSYFIIYPLSSFYLTNNFVPNFPFSHLPPPPTEHTDAILNHMSILPGGTLLPPPLTIPHLIRFLCRQFLRWRRETELLFGENHCHYTGVGTRS